MLFVNINLILMLLIMAANNKSILGTQLKLFRGDYLTQRDFAELLMISPIGYQNYEYGKRIPPEPILNKLAALLGTTPRALINGETACDRSELLMKLGGLSERGLERIEDLRFLSGLIYRAYSFASEKNVTAAWLVNYYDIFKILLVAAKNYKQFFPHLLKISLKPAITANVEEFLERLRISVLPHLTSSKTEKQQGLFIARLISILLLRAELSLTEKDWHVLREKLQPWCYWVGRHALFTDKFSIDTDILIDEYRPPEREKIELQKSYVSATIHLALYRKVESLLLEEKKLSAGITIKEGTRSLVTFATTANTLTDLISVAGMLKRDTRFAKGDGWEIRWEPEYDSIFIQKEAVRVYILNDQMEEFVTVIKEMSNNSDIRRDLALAWAAEYGAI